MIKVRLRESGDSPRRPECMYAARRILTNFPRPRKLFRPAPVTVAAITQSAHAARV
ncbi:MAG TPA: hypothetical protein VK363_06085 [Pyrinomonadaceae bacterium]|nr:hypothetical protein [Pyrinomonadaceae bacterium]